jgi:PKD repeat protein
MKIRWQILLLLSVVLFSCNKYEETTEDACFIPYVDFVTYHVDPASLEVSFTSVTATNGTIATHKWDFGDGTTYIGPTPPPHRYPAQGGATGNTYRIKYSVTNECGEGFWTKDIVISPCLANTKFSYSFPNDSTVQFTNTTTSPTPATYVWEFGDGTTNTSAGPVTKTYSADGTYNVRLKATNACGDNFYSAPITVCKNAIAAQTFAVSGCGTINIDASSSKNGGKYQWNFGNGVTLPASPGTSPTISYTYPLPGSYNITLTVISPTGCDTSSIVTPVYMAGTNVAPNNNWSFTSDDLSLNFSREAVANATSYSWNFGDGTISNHQNPGSKEYANPGTYTVTLSASNACNTYSFSSSINVPYFKSISNTPSTGFTDVVALSPTQIYYLGNNGKIYKTDTAGNWTTMNLPPSLEYNTSTKLFKDVQNNLWVYGRKEIAKWNPVNNSWILYFSGLGYPSGTTIESMAVDYNNTLWTVANNQVKKNNILMTSGNDIDFSSVAFAPGNGMVWVTASNRSHVYYGTGTGFFSANVPGINGGTNNMKVHPNGELYFTTSTGIMRLNPIGIIIGSYNASNTGGHLNERPTDYGFDSESNIWFIKDGRIYKMPIYNSGDTKNYSFHSTLNNIAALEVLNFNGTDNDLLLAKTSGNAAIQVK